MIWSILLILYNGLEHCHAQVESTGYYTNYLNRQYKFDSFPSAKEELILLPSFDNQMLWKEADLETNDPNYLLKPIKFAQAIQVNKDLVLEGHWRSFNSTIIDEIDGNVRTKDNNITTTDSHMMLQYEIYSKGALSLGLSFSDFHLSKGSELYVLSRNQTIGAFTGQINNKEHGKFSIRPLLGDRIRIVLIQSKRRGNDHSNDNDNDDSGDGGGDNSRLFLSTISHGFRPMPWNYPTAFGDSGSCNEDIACMSDGKWNLQSRSTVMLLTDSGQRFCSGAMMNNVRMDGKQYVLTANHCLFDNSDNWIAAFNYQNRECGKPSTLGDDQQLQTAHGMKLVATWSKSDFALLVIQESIPKEYNIYLSGWDRSPHPPKNVFCIHHPSGDVKKISSYNGTCEPGTWQEAPNQYHWLISKWTRGTTEPGSSGSPLFNSNGLVVGHLHGGQSSCEFLDGYDLFGGVAFDWDSGPAPDSRLKDHLGSEQHNNNNPMSLMGASLNILRENQHIIRRAQESGIMMNPMRWSFDNIIHESSAH